MSASKKQNYLHGAAILTVAVIIVKILGAVYKIPLGNDGILGDEGFGYFTVAYNLYNVLLTISTAGLPIALSKLISEANSLNKTNQLNKTFKVGSVIFIIFGLLGSSVMLLFPTELAYFMREVKASQSILAMAPSVVLVCIMSAYRGYTQGLSDMRPTSISQVIEVATKVIFGIGLAIILTHRGASLPVVTAGAIAGVTAGSFVGSAYLAYVGRKRKKEERIRVENDPSLGNDIPEKTGTIAKRLIKIGIPIALGSSILSVITLINTRLILDRLQSGAGMEHGLAIKLFGVYSKAQTLYNLPAAFITPLTISIIPAIAGYLAIHKNHDAREIVESSLRISTVIALPMAVGLSVLSAPIMDGLYYGSISQGKPLLAILGISSFFVCLSLMTTAILQSSGNERIPMYNMLVGGLLNIALVWYLTGNPNVNIFGAAIGTLVCYGTMSIINLVFVVKKFPERPKLSRIFIMPLVNCIIMGLVAIAVYKPMISIIGGADPTRGPILISLFISIGVAVIAYIILTIVTKTITIEDMKLMPKGEKIAKLLHIN